MLSCFSHVQLFASNMDCSLPGSSVHGILQARILEWVAMPSSEDLLDPAIKPVSPASPALQADFLPTEPLGSNVLIIILISSTSVFIALPFPLLVLCLFIVFFFLSISQIMVILTFFGEVLNMLILQNTLKDSKCLWEESKFVEFLGDDSFIYLFIYWSFSKCTVN